MSRRRLFYAFSCTLLALFSAVFLLPSSSASATDKYLVWNWFKSVSLESPSETTTESDSFLFGGIDYEINFNSRISNLNLHMTRGFNANGRDDIYASMSYNVVYQGKYFLQPVCPSSKVFDSNNNGVGVVLDCQVTQTNDFPVQGVQQDGSTFPRYNIQTFNYNIRFKVNSNFNSDTFTLGGVIFRVNDYVSTVITGNTNPASSIQFAFNGINFYTSDGNATVENLIKQGNEQAHQDSQAQLQESKKQTEIAEEQKNFVTDTSTPNASDIANSDSLPSVGLLPSGPLDSLLLLPLNIMNSIFSSLGGSCSPVVAPLPYVDQDVTFPCFGDTIYKGDFAPLNVLIGSVGSALILFYYFKHLYKKVDRATSLETTDDDEWGIL